MCCAACGLRAHVRDNTRQLTLCARVLTEAVCLRRPAAFKFERHCLLLKKQLAVAGLYAGRVLSYVGGRYAAILHRYAPRLYEQVKQLGAQVRRRSSGCM